MRRLLHCKYSLLPRLGPDINYNEFNYDQYFGHYILTLVQATAEVKALDSFYSMLQSEPNRAYYG